MSAITGTQRPYGPWNPGVLSQMPKDLRPLATIFRPENVTTSVAAADELHGLTGFAHSELVVFRPQRLALHELLIRVTADFAVPDGSRIGDLGINFREMAGRLLALYLAPEMEAIIQASREARSQVREAVEAALCVVVPSFAPTLRLPQRRLFGLLADRRAAATYARAGSGWGPGQIVEFERRAAAAQDALQGLAHQTVARVLSALFAAHGQPWGTRELIVSLAADLAGNPFASDAIGRTIDPILRRAAQREGYRLLPRQDQPVVINTKGPSASGKSTLRPLQKKLAGEIGVNWSDFALISPDIWRKQLLDYDALGTAYKYAGAFTADELQIVDAKLDHYMERKYRGGGMTHLLIDRFRFDSFAPDSVEEGSNFLTRFGYTVFLFFVITPPEQLVQRAWKRGLEFGRYKAVDDTLAHAVEAYTGIPNVFFTWVRRSDKRIHFEFLDNSVPFGERPRTVAFGDNETINVLDVSCLLDIDRYGRVFVDATAPEFLYPDRELLAAERNTRFLRRCVEEFRCVTFADRTSGRVYLRMESGMPVSIDPEALQAAVRDPDALAGVRAAAPGSLRGQVPAADRPQYLHTFRGDAGAGSEAGPAAAPTLGQWGDAARITQAGSY